MSLIPVALTLAASRISNLRGAEEKDQKHGTSPAIAVSVSILSLFGFGLCRHARLPEVISLPLP